MEQEQLAHASKLWGRRFIGIEKDQKYFESSLKRVNSVKENIENDCLKFAVLDKNPEPVSFKDLMKNGILKENEQIIIKDEIYSFNNDATITYNQANLSLNQLCKIIFKKSTNAWTNINLLNGENIDSLRGKYRDKVLSL